MQQPATIPSTAILPKGKLLIIGGHEDKIFSDGNFEILGKLINSIPHIHKVIEIIATASSIPAEMEATYVAAYQQAGYDHVGIIRIDSAADGQDAGHIARIHYAHAVFFTGGDQRKLTMVLNGTTVLAAIKKKYFNDPHFIVAGTSAGAMSLPEIIIDRGIIKEMLLKDDLITGNGFGLISGVIVDTHFIKRGRFGRLALAIAINGFSCTGIGLGEDGALLITNGNEAECLGTGMVIIIDGSNTGATNANTATNMTPIAIENLRVHILTEGCKYLIRERQFILAPTQ